MKYQQPTISDLHLYEAIIDVRSPAEFAEDHIPGAVNFPVLDDAQRAEVGTLYKQVSPFEAKKLGAALISENIAQHLKNSFINQPKSWKPLVYCWRGGDRSGAMTTILRAIGWPAGQLSGGYKAFRRQVNTDLEQLPKNLRFRVLCGPTGVAKTRLLRHLREQGGQSIDLEALAAHKGSVLGSVPERQQPSQKSFETALWLQLRQLDPQHSVFIEAESRKIGRIHLPDGLIDALHQSPCLEIQAPVEARIDFLLDDYEHFLKDPSFLRARLERLRSLLPRERIEAWLQLIDQAAWQPLIRALLEQHYDPLYRRSQQTHFNTPNARLQFETPVLSEEALRQLARRILDSEA